MSLETVDDARRIAGLSRAEYEDLLAYLERLDPAGWTEPSACDGWQVYQVVSHISSQPQIAGGIVRAALRGGEPMTEEQRKAIWAHFDSLGPSDMLSAFRKHNDELFTLLDSLTDEDLRQTISWIFGPAPVATVLAGRLNEQVLHAWDVRWARDRQAELSPATVPTLLELNLTANVGRLANPEQAEELAGKTIQFVLAEPNGGATIRVGPDGVQGSRGYSEAPDLMLEMASESLVRLLWGRFDIAAAIESGWLAMTRPELAGAVQALFPGR